MKPDQTARFGASFMLHSCQFHFLYIRICFEEKLLFVEILAALFKQNLHVNYAFLNT